MNNSHYIFMMAGKIVGWDNLKSDDDAVSVAKQFSDMNRGKLVGVYKMIGSSESKTESV